MRENQIYAANVGGECQMKPQYTVWTLKKRTPLAVRVLAYALGVGLVLVSTVTLSVYPSLAILFPCVAGVAIGGCLMGYGLGND